MTIILQLLFNGLHMTLSRHSRLHTRVLMQLTPVCISVVSGLHILSLTNKHFIIRQLSHHMPSHDVRCRLRSAKSGQLAVPSTSTNYGNRSFAVSGIAVWNSLPAELRLNNYMTLSVFRKRLKTFLMS